MAARGTSLLMSGGFMHFHVRIRHWVAWWFYVGVVCGVIALVNILGRNLSPTQKDIVLIVGALFWLLGGLACYGYDGVRIEMPPKSSGIAAGPETSRQQMEWHFASEFVLPGNRKNILPPRY
jgi:hypothetical protein